MPFFLRARLNAVIDVHSLKSPVLHAFGRTHIPIHTLTYTRHNAHINTYPPYYYYYFNIVIYICCLYDLRLIVIHPTAGIPSGMERKENIMEIVENKTYIRDSWPWKQQSYYSSAKYSYK